MIKNVEEEVVSVEDKTASLTGTGEFDVHEGANSFDVVVTAENGVTKTYHINVVVKEQNPIEVTLNSSDYTVVRKKEELEGMVPKSFEETTLKIGEEEVVAFQNKTLNLTLVALKDSKIVAFYLKADDDIRLERMLSRGDNRCDALERIACDKDDFAFDKVKMCHYFIDSNKLNISEMAEEIINLYRNHLNS